MGISEDQLNALAPPARWLINSNPINDWMRLLDSSIYLSADMVCAYITSGPITWAPLEPGGILRHDRLPVAAGSQRQSPPLSVPADSITG